MVRMVALERHRLPCMAMAWLLVGPLEKQPYGLPAVHSCALVKAEWTCAEWCIVHTLSQMHSQPM